jgi:hypothetical protein
MIAIQIPEALEVDQEYIWHFALKVDGELSTGTPFVDGVIKRVAGDTELQAALLNSTTTIERHIALAQNGVWYDAASVLADLLLAPNASNYVPEQIAQEWGTLLDSVSLSELKHVPLSLAATSQEL